MVAPCVAQSWMGRPASWQAMRFGDQLSRPKKADTPVLNNHYVQSNKKWLQKWHLLSHKVDPFWAKVVNLMWLHSPTDQVLGNSLASALPVGQGDVLVLGDVRLRLVKVGSSTTDVSWIRKCELSCNLRLSHSGFSSASSRQSGCNIVIWWTRFAAVSSWLSCCFHDVLADDHEALASFVETHRLVSWQMRLEALAKASKSFQVPLRGSWWAICPEVWSSQGDMIAIVPAMYDPSSMYLFAPVLLLSRRWSLELNGDSSIGCCGWCSNFFKLK